jgi:hypothetical protein
MYLTYRHELMQQTPLALDYAQKSMPFHGGHGNGEGTVSAGVHKILMLTFVCFETWLKPLFSHAERHNLSPIHEYDPYVVGLLRYLQSQRRDCIIRM